MKYTVLLHVELDPDAGLLIDIEPVELLREPTEAMIIQAAASYEQKHIYTVDIDTDEALP